MLRVLVVEDDEDLRLVVAETLGLARCDVWFASDGQEALRQLASGRPDVLLLDLMLPGSIDGAEVARRARAAGHAMPIVVISAMHDARARAAMMGATAVLPKPFEIDDLAATVLGLAPSA